MTEITARLQDFVESLGSPVVHFVGHSLGGLVIYRFLERFPQQPPGRAVFLGTPCIASRVAEQASQIRLVASLMGQPVADELLQDVFLQLVHAAARYEVQAKFTTWLYRIARNRLIDHLRAVEPETLHALQDAGEDGEDPLARLPADEAVQPERQALDRARAREFVNAVHDLPAPQREAFLLHAQSGLSLEQVAELCGSSRETVKSRFRYACAKLRNTMAHWSES